MDQRGEDHVAAAFSEVFFGSDHTRWRFRTSGRRRSSSEQLIRVVFRKLGNTNREEGRCFCSVSMIFLGDVEISHRS